MELNAPAVSGTEIGVLCERAMELYSCSMPFALVRVPGHRPVLREDPPVVDKGVIKFPGISVSPWQYDMPFPSSDADAFISTTKSEYIHALENLTASLRVEGGKTVIVRKVCGDVPPDFYDLVSFAHKLETYFNKLEDSMAYAFYTPETGLWFGATPELLLIQEEGKNARTQALAGSRPVMEPGLWSEKNMHEHTVVVEDMKGRISPKWEVAVGPLKTMRYGSVEHLCTPMEIVSAYSEFDSLAHMLHPTPAVCGYPREAAIGHIRAIERFPRRYYTGLITLRHDNLKSVYVLLRCVHIADGKYEIFTGSGVVPDSVPEDEWNETQAKAEPLIQLFL